MVAHEGLDQVRHAIQGAFVQRDLDRACRLGQALGTDRARGGDLRVCDGGDALRIVLREGGLDLARIVRPRLQEALQHALVEVAPPHAALQTQFEGDTRKR